MRGLIALLILSFCYISLWSGINNKVLIDGHWDGSLESEDGNWEVFVMDRDGSGRRNLTNNEARNDSGASWPADATRTAYSSGMNDQYEIYIMDADGQNARRVTYMLPEFSEFVDSRDGQTYATKKFGNQEWMTRNMAYASNHSWCYGDNPDDCKENGRLYTWQSAMEACPSGWRLPTDEDWMALEMHLGMPEEEAKKRGPRGTDEGARLRAGGSSGFDAPISGYRRPAGEYARRGERAAFWLATEANVENAWHRDIRPDVGTIYRSEVTKTYALSVRCIRSQ